MLRLVIDTNVLFAGLTRSESDGKIIDAWVQRLFLPCVSTALALEYQAVLLSKLSPQRRALAKGALQALLKRAEFVPVHFTYRPASPDPGDDHVVDCVLNGRAALVTRNIRDFRQPARHLGFRVLEPEELLSEL